VENNSERAHTWEAFGTGYVVVSYPVGVVIERECATEYKWRFRNTTLRAAHSHSVSVSAVVQALNEMGAGMADLPLTVGRRLTNHEDIDALPDGSLVKTGEPENPGSFGLFKIRDESSYHVMGAQRTLRRQGAVIAELPADYTPPVVDEGEAALNAFKVRAYVIGLKVKGAQDWCGTYENIVAPLGISPEAIRPLVTGHELLGSKVNPEGAAAMPLGTILSWQNENHTACSWFVRVEQAGNKAGTRRIFAHAAEGVTGRPGHFAGSMTVAWVPPSETEAAIPGINMLAEVQGLNVIDHWDYLPPGTVLSWRATQFYLIHRDGRASQFRFVPGQEVQVNAVGQYNRDSFGSPQDMRVVLFPTPTAHSMAQIEVSDDQPF